ncbi:hypothetical protein J5N97_005773 [Dioscorea zingiberensis]|uniref:Meiosis-specific protein ASY3-like coiled-coil domain-containing protein n=1 Tax=Dioscorea zingiberensis TaxID=325984 RepID=A0A9D5DB93_9LILI|nr:hypothetical protein J5N97_005773 [Dioscorea zingiberensis]
MKIETQKVQNSFSSIQYQAGRFPKVSIGITVDEHQKIGSNHARKDDCGALPPLRRTSLSQEKVIEEKNKPVTIRPVEEKQVVNEKQRAATCSSAECQETPTMKPFHFRAKLNSALQSEGGGKKSDDVVYGKSSGNTKTVEEAAMQEIGVAGTRSTAKSDKVPSCNTEALRTKLWEILGVSTQEKQTANLPGPDDSSKHSNIDPKDKSQMAEAAKHKENSDTIEDDTENPNQTVKRPLTRSLTKKKAAPKTVPKMQHEFNHIRKSLSSPSRGLKLKFQENIFSFHEREGRNGISGCASKGQSASSNRKNIKRKKAGIDPQKESFPQETHSEKCRKTNEKNQIVKPAIKASPRSKNAGDHPCRPCQSKEVSRTYEVRKSNQTLEASKSNEDGKGNQTSHIEDARENFNSLPLGNSKEIPENADSMFLKVKTNSYESLKTPSVRRNENLQKKPTSPPWTTVDDFQSPTLAMDGTPPFSTSKTPDKGLLSPGLAQPKTFGRRLFSSGSSDDSGPNSGSEMDTDPSDNSGGISPLLNPTVGQAVEKEIEKPLSQSPTEECNAWSFEADVVANKGFKQMDGSSGNATSRKKYPFSLRHTKRFHNLEDLKIGKIEPSSPAPTAPSRTHKNTIANEASDLYPKDSLERATVQLALILERFNAKIKSHTSKKSSEILMSAADKLCVKLQDVESEIQADLVKFASANKLKRKHLEAKFEDKQEQLRSVHDKFKEDVKQHLLDYKNNIEEFQADQMELKASVERQSRRSYILFFFNLITRTEFMDLGRNAKNLVALSSSPN